MTADDEEELHAMATKIGLQREWFQAKSSTPHYDLTASKRAPGTATHCFGLVRDHESYVVAVSIPGENRLHVYWPNVADLEVPDAD